MQMDVNEDFEFEFSNRKESWVFRSVESNRMLVVTSPVFEKRLVYYSAMEYGINDYKVTDNTVVLGLCKDPKDYETVDFSIELKRGSMSNLDWFEFTLPNTYTGVPSAEGLRL